MDRHSLMLAALAASDGAVHSPSQVQKLFFMLDREIPAHVGGPFFQWMPFDYGPFDVEVYTELQTLAHQNLVTIEQAVYVRVHRYRLTPQGQRAGDECLRQMTPAVAEYLQALSAWVRHLSFAQLVSAVYQSYPDMAVNAVFRSHTGAAVAADAPAPSVQTGIGRRHTPTPRP